MREAKVVVDKTIELLGGIDVIIANAVRSSIYFLVPFRSHLISSKHCTSYSC